ncbi:MAG TPA: vanadium-dependent haloperoxidase [Roseiarcus sp.]|nr:vanadium-dependent haloperoxidase [Roseiarcus sp.]
MSTPASINSTILSAILATNDPRKYFILWHLIALDVTALDHRADLASNPATYHEQLGPARTSRAMALIHQAMFEAANAFEATPKYASTIPGLEAAVPAKASKDAAMVEAAYQIIAWLYPGLNEQKLDPSNDMSMVCQSGVFSLSAYHQCSLFSIDNTDMARENGVAVGRAIAGAIIESRSHDGAEIPEPVWGKDFVPRRKATGGNYSFHQWLPDPVSLQVTALGGYWGNVRPFAMTSGFQFRPSEDPSPNGLVDAIEQAAPAGSFPSYGDLASYNAVHKWGQEVRMDPAGKITQPSAAGDAYFVAQYWAYDGTANLCAPARLYNQIAAAVLAHLDSVSSDGYGVIDVHSTLDVARFYALINMAMADAAIAAWDAKYHFQFPRPVTYIRANEQATGAPSGSALKWYPVGAQITNSDQPYNITPPFPSYPSGHAVFGGALFGVLRQFIKPTATFQFLSDEFNGSNKDAFNYIRCKPGDDQLTPAKFCASRDFTINCAERENADSRVFMGVHWVFDADDGIHMGNQVARQTYLSLMKPADGGGPHDPPTQSFSTDPTINMRSALVCNGINYPTGWDNASPKVGFGPLNIISVP